jgi:predicted AAA+ superfamily ATPase
MDAYLPRLIDQTLGELLQSHPAVLLTGPRAAGKTTTALQFAKSAIRLDHPEQAAVVTADPDGALVDLARPTLIDEWQVVPEILGALKRAVDRNPDRGQFIVTGSVRGDLDSPTWPGTGRLIRIDMFGLTPAELSRRVPEAPMLDRLADGDLSQLQAAQDTLTLRDYVGTALTSGFPEPALRLDRRGRTRWLDSYVDQLLTRDLAEIAERRDPARLRRFVEVYALHTAGVADLTSLVTTAGISRPTGDAYERLLQNLLVAHTVPAWWTNRLKRLAKSPKHYIVDAALVAAIVRVDLTGLMRDSDMLGRILDTFVMSQLRAELSRCESRPRLYHLRDQDGRREVDTIVEYGGGRVLGLEVKATSAPKSDDARHLSWLRNELGDRFLGGIVLHTGARPFPLGDRIVAAPMSSLWS